MKSNPRHVRSGRLTHCASITRPMSYRPIGAATATPDTSVSGKVHRRRPGEPFSVTSAPTARAAIPGIRKRSSDTPAGAITVRLTMNGTAETATSMMIVPLTVGVNSLRNDASRIVIRSCRTVETITRLASRPGPPVASASVVTARNGTLKFVTTRRPDPMCQKRNEWSMMLIPVMTRPENIAHDR